MASQTWADESQAENELSTPDASPGSTVPTPLSNVKLPAPDTSRYPPDVDIANNEDFRRRYLDELGQTSRRPNGGRRSSGGRSSPGNMRYTEEYPALPVHDSPQPSLHFDKFLLLKFDDSVDLNNMDLYNLFDDITACAGSPLKNMYRNNRRSYVLETTSSLQVQTLLSVNKIAGCDVTISVFATLNQCKGVITCPELNATPIDKIKNRTAAQGVTYVRRVKRWENGELVPTHTYVFTFNLTHLPPAVRVSYLNLPLRLYIDNPRKCHKCQRYGHVQTDCSRDAICYRCSTSLPDETHKTPCDRTPLCCHCQGPHPTSFHGCPEYKKQVKILTVVAMDHVTIGEAVKRVNDSGLFSHKSFAAVTRRAAAKRCRKQVASQDFVSSGNSFCSANHSTQSSQAYASALVSPTRLKQHTGSNGGSSFLQQPSTATNAQLAPYSSQSSKNNSHNNLSLIKRRRSWSAGAYFSHATNSTLVRGSPMDDEFENMPPSNSLSVNEPPNLSAQPSIVTSMPSPADACPVQWRAVRGTRVSRVSPKF